MSFCIFLRAGGCCVQVAVWLFGVNADWKPWRCSYFAFKFAQEGKMPRQSPRSKVPARLSIIMAAVFISTNEGIKYLLAPGAVGKKKQNLYCFAHWNMKVWLWCFYETHANWGNATSTLCPVWYGLWESDISIPAAAGSSAAAAEMSADVAEVRQPRSARAPNVLGLRV